MEQTQGLLAIGGDFCGYRVDRLLGHGGLGFVYLVVRPADGVRFALKILDPAVADEKSEYVRRFVREATLATKIRHPNLVHVHDTGRDEATGIYYIVMEYVDGCNLRTAIGMGGAMDHREAVRIVAAVAGALAAGAQFGVVHRDIKPENIMLEEDGMVKLVDLGVAKARGTDSLVTMQSSVFGTPNYISPEQAQDASAVDGRADVYSLGIVLYELLCGRRPYRSDKMSEVLCELLSPDPLPDVRTFNPAVPAQLAELLPRMCAKAREERIASASALLEVFAGLGYETSAQGSRAPDQPTAAAGATAVPGQEKSLPLSTNNTLSFDTKDEEICEFVSKVKLRRRRKRIASVLGAILAATALAAALALLFR